MIIRKACTAVTLSVVTVCAGFCYAPPSYAETSNISFDNRLVDAVENNNYEIVSALVQNGEDVNETGKFNTNALQRAAYNGNIDILNLLLKSGANINSVDFGGASALHMAARQGQPLITKLLVQKGAKIDLQDDQGYTPLHRAVSNGKLTITQLLIQAGAKVNTVNNEGNSPLIDAVRTENLSMVKELLLHGANKTIRNNKGQDVIDYAMRSNNHDIDVEISKNYNDLIAQNEAMQKTGFNDTTPAFLKQEASSAQSKNTNSSFNVASVPIAKVEVEELKPSTTKTTGADIHNNEELQRAPRIEESTVAQVAETKPAKINKPVETAKLQAPAPAPAPKSWIKTTGEQTAHQDENILPKSMKITDSEAPIKLTDIENTGSSISLGRIEGVEAPSNKPQENKTEKPKPETSKIAEIKPAAKAVTIDKDYENEVDSIMNQLTSDAAASDLKKPPVKQLNQQAQQPAPQPEISAPTLPVTSLQVNRTQQTSATVTSSQAIYLQPQTTPIAYTTNTDKNSIIEPIMENSGSGMPDSLKYRDFVANRGYKTPLTPMQPSIPQYNIYPKTTKIDKNYMNEVDMLMDQLTSDNSGSAPLRSQQLVNQPIYQQQVYPRPATAQQPAQGPRQGLYIPAAHLQKNIASVPFQNENGDFVTPPVAAQQNRISQPAFKPMNPAPDGFSSVVKTNIQNNPSPNSNVNYNSYRSNLLKNVDEFYNNSQENYGSLDMSNIERQREQNLSLRKAADEKAIHSSAQPAPEKDQDDKVVAAPAPKVESEDLQTLPVPEEKPAD